MSPRSLSTFLLVGAAALAASVAPRMLSAPAAEDVLNDGPRTRAGWAGRHEARDHHRGDDHRRARSCHDRKDR